MDIVSESNTTPSSKQLLAEQRKGAAKPMLWIGMASMFMAFSGLMSGYIVSRSALIAEQNWLTFALPNQFYISTALILASSITMHWAYKSAKSGNTAALKIALIITMVLGLAFGISQFLGWRALTSGGVFFTGPGSNPAGSWIYAITAFHIAHVLGGLIALFITTIKAQIGTYSATNYLGVALASMFWHFLDLVWICLFLFLLFIR